MATVLIRTEAGPEIGMLRLQRTLLLARLLAPRHEVMLVLSGPACLRQRLARLGLRVSHPLAMDHALLDSQVLICDLSRSLPEEDWLSRASLVRRLSLVDMGVGAAAGEVAVDGSVVPFAAGSPKVLHRFGGPAYAVLEPRLRRLRARPRPDPGTPQRLGLCLDTALASRELASCLEKTARLLEGKVLLSTPPRSFLSRKARTDWLACQDLVLAQGDYALYETATLGLPALVVWRDVREAITARSLHNKGYGWSLGDVKDIEPAQLAKQILSLAGNQHACHAMQQAARSLVDGRGASRVVTLVETLMQDRLQMSPERDVVETASCPAY